MGFLFLLKFFKSYVSTNRISKRAAHFGRAVIAVMIILGGLSLLIGKERRTEDRPHRSVTMDNINTPD